MQAWRYHMDMRLQTLQERNKTLTRKSIVPLRARKKGLEAERGYWQQLMAMPKKK
jgi:hypothetical protein